MRLKNRFKQNVTLVKLCVITISIAIVFVFSVLNIWRGLSSNKKDITNNSVKDEVLDDQNMRIENMISEMTIEEKVGQLFLARVPDENQLDDITNLKLGGYLMFGKDFRDETPESITNKISTYQSVANIPLFIAVDEEGGSVSRLNQGIGLIETPDLSPQALFDQGGWEAIHNNTIKKSIVLKKYGINLNLAPVADVSNNVDSFIYERTIGGDSEKTSQYVQIVVLEMKQNGMGSCLKHFPGYGDNADSHEDIVYDSRPLSTFENSDFKPFESGIKAGADSVLVTHNIVECLNETLPASLSPEVYSYLREQLMFRGVVITDDFKMEGLSNFTNQEDGAVLCLQAGGDMIISSSYQRQIPYVIQAINKGHLTEKRIDESVRRILIMKTQLRMIE